jgi:transposase
MTRIVVIVENDCRHKATAVAQQLASHTRVAVIWLPTYCPRANLSEQAFSDIHDKCIWNHTRKRRHELVKDGEQPMQENGPWPYKLS